MTLLAACPTSLAQPADPEQLEARLGQTLEQLRAAQQRKNQLGEELERVRQELAEAKSELAAERDAGVGLQAQLAVLRHDYFQLLDFLRRDDGLVGRWEAYVSHDGFLARQPPTLLGSRWREWPFYVAER